MADKRGIVERMAEAVQEVACARVGITPVFPVPQLFIEDVLAAVAALKSHGYVIVPKEPTEAMKDAALHAVFVDNRHDVRDDTLYETSALGRAYRAMISTAIKEE